MPPRKTTPSDSVHDSDRNARDPAPHALPVCIEISRGSQVRYLPAAAASALATPRQVIHTMLPFPFHLGFVPRSRTDSDAPLRALIFSETSLNPLATFDTRVLGAVRIRYSERMQIFLIAVYANDQEHFDGIEQLQDLPGEHLALLARLLEFLRLISIEEPEGIEEFYDRDRAMELARSAVDAERSRLLLM